MRIKYFAVRMINLVIILALLSVYQNIAVVRADKEAAAVCKAKKEAAQARRAAGNSAGADSGVYKDGSYEGSAEGYGGKVTMKVEIKDGRINSIEEISAAGEDASYWKMAKGLIPDIVEAQEPNVDTVSGATYSSTGIINAVTEALQKAVK